MSDDRARPVQAGRLRFDLDDERLARAAWSRLAEPRDGAAADLLREHGAGGALREVLAGRGQARWWSRWTALDPARDVRTVARLGGRLVIPTDEEWPPALADLDEVVGPDGRTLQQPFCLWVRGPADLAEVSRRAVAVVGARAVTPYGEHVAGELAFGLVDRGFTVVSGGAFGVDGAAHRAALAAAGGGRATSGTPRCAEPADLTATGRGLRGADGPAVAPTVGVLACGVDRAYPLGHERLQSTVARHGALVSEVPPGSAPTRWRFLDRNRLIAAMSLGTVVVEAAWRSGALSTADRAERLGRRVAAVPGPVTSPSSAGCHRLIRDGQAQLVTDAADVAELMAPAGEHLLPERQVTPTELDPLPELDRRVAESLPVRRGRPVESVAATAGLDASAVRSALGRLALLGLAEGGPGGWRRAPTPP